MAWMKRLNTLRARFAVWVAGLLLVVLGTFGGLVYASLAQGLAASIDDSLRLSATQAIAAVNIENGQINFTDSIPDGSAAAGLRDRGVTIRILSPSGQSLESFGPYRNLPVLAESLAAGRQQQSSFATLPDATGQTPVRVFTAPIVQDNQVIGLVQVAQSLQTIQDTLRQLLAVLVIGGLSLTGVAAVAGYLLAARALAPIDRITLTARQIANGADLSARLKLPATEDEVGRLAATFDLMLTRLDEAFRRERQFTADASHELRTPLAAIQAILSVIRAERRTPEDYEAALDDLAEEADRLRSLVEALMRLARNDARPVTDYRPVDLSSLLTDLADSLRPLAQTKGLPLICQVPPGVMIAGDGDDLTRLFLNLLDNAVKYTEAGTIAIALAVERGLVRVSVTDTGRGIAARHLPFVFDRFYRAEAARSVGGAGLGLAIAADLARAHGGRIEVASQEGAGSTFTVLLPALT